MEQSNYIFKDDLTIELIKHNNNIIIKDENYNKRIFIGYSIKQAIKSFKYQINNNKQEFIKMKKNKEEIISIVNNEFKSSIEDDWNGQFINLNEYWVNELKHTDQVDIKNIKDYKLFDYINKGFDLMDYYQPVSF